MLNTNPQGFILCPQGITEREMLTVNGLLSWNSNHVAGILTGGDERSCTGCLSYISCENRWLWQVSAEIDNIALMSESI